MKDWHTAINDKIKEYVLVTYIVSGLIYGSTLFMILNMSLTNFSLVELITGLLLIALMYFFLSKSIDRVLPSQKLNKYSIILSAVNLVIITLVSYFSAFKELDLRSLYFIPVIQAALSYNKIYRFVVTGICSFSILFIDYLNLQSLQTPHTLDSSVIFVTILFLASWLIGGLRDIDFETNKYLQTLANYDGLTGLMNHRYFQERLEAEIQAAFHKKQVLSLIMADLDFFKFYNDTYGHQYGDEVLRQVGQILKEETTNKGFAARYGGEEFAIILPGFTKEKARSLAENIRKKISTYDFYGAKTQPQGKLTISYGIASYPTDAITKKELIEASDQALYQAKAHKPAFPDSEQNEKKSSVKQMTS